MGIGRINGQVETEDYLLEKYRYFYCYFIAEEWRFIIFLVAQR